MAADRALEAARWLAQAQDDLVTAERLAEIGIHYASCFFAQQAAEKGIKGVLIARGATYVRGHSVSDLCTELGTADADFVSLADELAPLDLYYIPTRYPNGLAGGVASRVFNSEDSARALRLARRAIEAARAGTTAWRRH